MTRYLALSTFRSVSRPELGTVLEGASVDLEDDHAAMLGALVTPLEDATPAEHVGPFSVGEHAGGGWYPVLDASDLEVDKVRGLGGAQARAADLNADE